MSSFRAVVAASLVLLLTIVSGQALAQTLNWTNRRSAGRPRITDSSASIHSTT